ncbi:LRAT-like domain [Sesbania bispinosa]|nr:LRAT-like domain [Sesbania bispinosa]
MTGIYVGDDQVIHFTARGQVGSGSVLDLFVCSSFSSGLTSSSAHRDQDGGVISSCLNCFLAGGTLNRFEYGVSTAYFLAKGRGGTCTLAKSDGDDIVVHRAKYLLENENGFGCYNVFKKNYEDFAIYCKTGLLQLVDQGRIGQSGQAGSVIGLEGSLAAAVISYYVVTNVYGVAATIGVYCASRYIGDIGNRKDVVAVEVEYLTDFHNSCKT